MKETDVEGKGSERRKEKGRKERNEKTQERELGNGREKMRRKK